MERIKELLNNVKDRFSNPLLFSFACSWIVINWQITVSLLWYSSDQIEKEGFNSIFDFISSRINTQDALWHPLFFALTYTILMPTIKNLIRALYSWTEKWGENWNLKILKGGKIPIEKYLKFRESYEKRTKLLEQVIDKEDVYTSQLHEINTQLLENKSTINKLQQQVTEKDNFILQLNDVRILNGYWTNTYSEKNNPQDKRTEEIYIQDGMYSIVEKFGNKLHKFNITHFYYNIQNKSIFFTKQHVGSNILNQKPIQPVYLVNVLTVEREDLLIGSENVTIDIEYKKKVGNTILEKS